MRFRPAKTILIVLGIFLGLIICCGLVYYFYYLINWSPMNFSSDAWKRGSPEIRGRMSSDLLFRLKGLDEKQVSDLLGTPNMEKECGKDEYMGRYLDARKVKTWNLIVHDFPVTFFENQWLDVGFDKDGVCVGVTIIGD